MAIFIMKLETNVTYLVDNFDRNLTDFFLVYKKKHVPTAIYSRRK